MLVKTAVGGFLNRVRLTPAGIWVDDEVVSRKQNVLGVLGRPDGKLLIPARNIVTDAGDLHYAQRAVSEALTNAFDTHEMATAAASGHPSKTSDRSNFTTDATSQKATASGYPTRNDGDADNTGSGVDIVTHLVSYTKGDFDTNSITHGIITNSTPGASEALLTGYAFSASFNKTSDDTLKVFVNHELLGV